MPWRPRPFESSASLSSIVVGLRPGLLNSVFDMWSGNVTRSGRLEQLEMLNVGSEAAGLARGSACKRSGPVQLPVGQELGREPGHIPPASEYLPSQARQAARCPRIAALSGRTAKQHSRCAQFGERAEDVASTRCAMNCPNTNRGGSRGASGSARRLGGTLAPEHGRSKDAMSRLSNVSGD